MPGERFTRDNVWVKRPGTGEIKAEHYDEVLGTTATRHIRINEQIKWCDCDGER
jgi:N-acetylneuraminate synthase